MDNNNAAYAAVENNLLAQHPPEDAEEVDDEDDDVDEEPSTEEFDSEFNLILDSLESGEFTLWKEYDRLTISQTIILVNALNMKKEKRAEVHSIFFSLESCPLEMVQNFVDYIRSSTTLRCVEAKYLHEEARGGDNEETRLQYQAHMEEIFYAVQDNPHIQKFIVGTLPSSRGVIYNLLSKTEFLQEFHIRCDSCLSLGVAREFGGGMSRNSSIKSILLETNINEPLRIALSGLGASKVKTLVLDLYWDKDDEEDMDLNKLYGVVSNLLRTTPSLRHVTVGARTCNAGVIMQASPNQLGNILLDLRDPACDGLQSLTLQDTTLVSGTCTAWTGDMTNSTLRKLRLNKVRFSTPADVRLLWSLVGLHELEITNCKYAEKQSADLSHHENWAEFFRRNKELRNMRLEFGDRTLYSGVLEGATCHNSIQELVIQGWSQGWSRQQLKESVLARLCRIVQDWTSLENLQITSFLLDSVCTRPLSRDLVNNATIRVLCFKYCQLANVSCVRELLESVLQNQTLHNVAFTESNYHGLLPNNQVVDVAQTLAQGFRGNSTLRELTLSSIDLRGDLLPDILALALKKNKSLKKLIFVSGLIDNEGLTSLGRALESTDIALEEIGLPARRGLENNYKDLVEGTRAFLHSMAHAQTLRTVHFGYIRTDLQEEMHQLLLAAVKVNKNICSVTFGPIYYSDTPIPLATDMTEIEYYLKLNRFGRRLLNSPNVLVSLWPIIFSRISTNEADADALFYFVREYFSRKSAKEYETTQPQQPLWKKMRLV